MTDTSTTAPGTHELPGVVHRYLEAHTARDTAAAVAALTADATVTDDGHTYRGRAAVAQWLDGAASEYTYTTELLSAHRDAADHFTVTQRLRGDFPGGTVDLRFRFTLDGDLISRLTIAP
ncbi:nuclear transport factor 2 family protein [Streptomyces sp. NPDC047841]|uniref:nuclear transport factor 2 family protein n=1 Tax=Streptomyces sp. NPDC047841 TaxID=3154708 RepID=UPI003451E18D